MLNTSNTGPAGQGLQYLSEVVDYETKIEKLEAEKERLRALLRGVDQTCPGKLLEASISIRRLQGTIDQLREGQAAKETEISQLRSQISEVAQLQHEKTQLEGRQAVEAAAKEQEIERLGSELTCLEERLAAAAAAKENIVEQKDVEILNLRQQLQQQLSAAFHDAKALWKGVLDEWKIDMVCLRWRILYVHRSTNKVLPAFGGIPTMTSNPKTPESVLKFDEEKKRQAFHLGFIACHTPENALTEEAVKEFISMTHYLRDTHQMFVQPCGEKNFFFHGGIKFIDDHYVEFKALDDYKEPEQPGINLLTATINLVRSRAAMGYYSKDTQTY